MPRNLTFDSRNSCCIPYDDPPPGLTAQLQRLVTEERPGPASAAGSRTAAPPAAARCCGRLAGLWRLVREVIAMRKILRPLAEALVFLAALILIALPGGGTDDL